MAAGDGRTRIWSRSRPEETGLNGIAFLVAVGAAEAGRPTLMFCAKEAVRLIVDGVAAAVACTGCPPLPDLVQRYEKAGGQWKWIGDDGATTFSC